MKQTAILVLLVLFTAAGACHAQSFGFFGGVSMPLGDFAGDGGEKAGYAKTGYGGGVEFCMPIGTGGLGWIASGAFVLNGIDIDKYPIDEYEEEGIRIVSFDMGSWMNVPLMTGVRFEAEASPALGVYGMGLGGLSLVKAPKMDIDGRFTAGTITANFSSEVTWDLVTAFCFGFGGGVIIGERFNVDVRYLNIGEPEFGGKACLTVAGSSESIDKDLEKVKQSISMLLITAGVSF